MISADESIKIDSDENGTHISVEYDAKITKKQFFEILSSHKNLYELKFSLDLTTIKLYDIVKSFPTLKKLAYCNFSDHSINGITDEVIATSHIENLYVDWHGKRWPKWIFALPKITILELCTAEIQSLPKEIYDMQKLEILDIHLCPFLTFSIKKMKKIKTLKLIYAEASQIPQFPYMENYTPVKIEMSLK